MVGAGVLVLEARRAEERPAGQYAVLADAGSGADAAVIVLELIVVCVVLTLVAAFGK